ncbi:MAG TPA: sigma-70 family RNA polymerase sigma factor [Vicinamibacterales bacterium]|nr:sigma-70 family RNA polymerase sigma factor [Vicinamibacterales bacterium]
MDDVLVGRLFREAGADQWEVPRAFFADALDRSAAKAFAGRTPSAAELDRYFGSLHLGDLALACGCALGHDRAWDYFVTEYRPVLYRAADALEPGGGAREAAESLFADLYGLKRSGNARQSLFRYFHGRSSLATWLRALVSQRYVDHVRAHRRLAPLPDEASPAALPAPAPPPNPDGPRFAAAFSDALGRAIARLDARDRLRLGCYYAQEMTLASIGRITGEHEATVSRHLARTRRGLRNTVEQWLRTEHGFGDREIAECFASIAADSGSLDLGDWLAPSDAGKNPRVDRSTSEGLP